MWSSLKEHYRPATIEGALHLLARSSPRTVPLAGGTQLVAARDPTIGAVVELSALNLTFVQLHNRRLHLGAMTTLQSLISDSLVSVLASGLLGRAARRSVPRAIRNMATLGGTLAAGETTSGVLLALLALDAQVVIRTPTLRRVSTDDFLGNRAKLLSPVGLIVEIIVPLPLTRFGAALAEVSSTPRGRPVVNAVARVSRQRDQCREARLALGGVAPNPIRLPAIEIALSGHVLDDEMLAHVAHEVSAAVSPPSDTHASAHYRREMAGVVAARALREAWSQTEKEGRWTSL